MDRRHFRARVRAFVRRDVEKALPEASASKVKREARKHARSAMNLGSYCGLSLSFIARKPPPGGATA